MSDDTKITITFIICVTLIMIAMFISFIFIER